MALQIIILLLLASTISQSDCFSQADTIAKYPAQGKTQTSSAHHEPTSDGANGDGHPALLNAIADFSPIAYGKEANAVDACRIFHGRGGLYPGADHLTLDYYPPVFLLTSFNQELDGNELNVYGDALSELWENCKLQGLKSSDDETATAEEEDGDGEQEVTWTYQHRAPKGKTTTQLMAGHIPEPQHIVTENSGSNKYLVHLTKGQNHGLFLDMAAGRSWLQHKCNCGDVSSVLNLFAYTCAFSVAALNEGAKTVVNVDMSHGALKIGQRNHNLNGLTTSGGGGAKFLSHDLFKSWGKLKRYGPYDCVVADPPSYQKGSFVATKDYIKVIRRLPSLLNPDGWALLCLNAPELDTNFLLEKVMEGAPELEFVERLDNPRTFATAFPEKELKVLVFRFRPLPES